MDEEALAAAAAAAELAAAFDEVGAINENMDQLQQLFPAALARRHSFGCGSGFGDCESSSGSVPGSPTGPMSPMSPMSPATATAVGRRRRESMAAVCEALTLARSTRSSLDILQAKTGPSEDLEKLKMDFVAACRTKLKHVMARFTSETIEDAVETEDAIRSPRSPRSFRALSFR